MREECHLCNAPSPRLYTLPPRVSQARPGVGPACYFCFIRVAGIKPTRRQIVSGGGVASALGQAGRVEAGGLFIQGQSCSGDGLLQPEQLAYSIFWFFAVFSAHSICHAHADHSSAAGAP